MEIIQMITNETIIKAAKAAGLDARLAFSGVETIRTDEAARCHIFAPLHNDTDSAMIRRGAEIDVDWLPETKYRDAYVDAAAWILQPDTTRKGILRRRLQGNDKSQAEREAVILCAAAKWDAIQGDQK